MAIITTRKTTDAEEVSLRQSLFELIERETDNAVSFDPNKPSMLNLSGTNEEVLSTLDTVLKAYKDVLARAGADNAFLHISNAQLQLEVKQMDMLLERFTDVPFDHCLDDATLDLMTHIESTGAAEMTSNGELEFDARVTWSRNDIKPILRQAILSWIDRKLNA